MSLETFGEIVGAWNRAHDPEAAKDISDAEVAELSAWLDSVPAMGSA